MSVELLGLRVGDEVRWRPTGKRTWVVARVTGVEADGSVACVDGDGRARAVVADRLEVRRRRGRWAPLARPQQLELFADPAPARPAAAGAPPPTRRRGRR